MRRLHHEATDLRDAWWEVIPCWSATKALNEVVLDDCADEALADLGHLRFARSGLTTRARSGEAPSEEAM